MIMHLKTFINGLTKRIYCATRSTSHIANQSLSLQSSYDYDVYSNTIYRQILKEEDAFAVKKLFTLHDLMDAGIHFGHKVGTLDNRMSQFLFGERLGICIFDLEKTIIHLQQALNFLAHIAFRDGIILFSSWDRQNAHLIEKTALECGEYAHCWPWNRVSFPTELTNSKNESRLPDVIVMTKTCNSVFEQHEIIVEGSRSLIPIVAVVDSNCNPNLISYPIPGNDDSFCAVQLYLRLFKEAVLSGKHKRKLLFGQC